MTPKKVFYCTKITCFSCCAAIKKIFLCCIITKYILLGAILALHGKIGLKKLDDKTKLIIGKLYQVVEPIMLYKDEYHGRIKLTSDKIIMIVQIKHGNFHYDSLLESNIKILYENNIWETGFISPRYFKRYN